ncbi:CYTH domain-containing protein [Glycomyces sp. NPDC047369]
MQREVEVKFQVDSVDTVMAKFHTEEVVWSDPVLQDDQAFAPSDWAYGMSKIGVPFARLRTEGARHLFTVKTPQSNEMDCLEYETAVSDRAAMHAAVIALGFTPTVRIVKKRRTATWDAGSWGEVTLCLDEVAQIGTFLEIEIVTEDNPAHVQEWLDRRVRDLGVEGMRVTDTYDTLVRNVLLVLGEWDPNETSPAND